MGNRKNVPEKRGKENKSSSNVVAQKNNVSSTTSHLATSKNDVIQQIRQLELMILESNLHLNQLLQLIKWAEPQQSPKIIYTALHALTRLFSYFHEAGYFKPQPDATNESSQEAELKVATWLKRQWAGFEMKVLQYLNHKDPSLQLAATEALLKLIFIKCNEFHRLDNRNLIDCDYLGAILPHIFKMGSWSKQFNETFFNYIFKFDDLRLYFFRTLIRHLKKENLTSDLPHKKEPTDFSPDEIEKISQFGLHLFENLLQFPTKNQDLKRFLVNRKTIPADHSVFSVSHHKHAFSEFVMEYLSFPLPLPHYKKILLLIPQKIIPYLVDPRMLMTFLTLSYNQGGSISLLALQSVFLLITKHNLDYPEFYKKLYNLFDRNLLHVKYRSRFFRLFETFMSSTHLPTYLIAAFIKRMARLALCAPPGGIMIVVPFIYNLLKEHPQCACLLHRTDLFSTDDPFLMDEEDPLRSKALESSLWELELLEKHYFPNIASMFRLFRKPFTKDHYEVEDFLDYNFANLFESVHVKAIKSVPPLSDTPPKVLIQDEENPERWTQQLFSF